MSSEKTASIPTYEEIQDLDHFLKQIHQRMDLYETYVARRFDELSAEIDASSQLSEKYSEDISEQFSEVLHIINGISMSAGNAPMNAGVELEKVIEVTENAANKIMDASDRIMEKLSDEEELKNPQSREKILGEVKQEVQEILLACSFQDLTGQRVRKTLENIQIIEERLSNTLDKLGIQLEHGQAPSPPSDHKEPETIASQDDIDSLFD